MKINKLLFYALAIIFSVTIIYNVKKFIEYQDDTEMTSRNECPNSVGFKLTSERTRHVGLAGIGTYSALSLFVAVDGGKYEIFGAMDANNDDIEASCHDNNIIIRILNNLDIHKYLYKIDDKLNISYDADNCIKNIYCISKERRDEENKAKNMYDSGKLDKSRYQNYLDSADEKYRRRIKIMNIINGSENDATNKSGDVK